MTEAALICLFMLLTLSYYIYVAQIYYLLGVAASYSAIQINQRTNYQSTRYNLLDLGPVSLQSDAAVSPLYPALIKDTAVYRLLIELTRSVFTTR